MRMTYEKAKNSGLIGSVTVLCDGKIISHAIEFMTGSKGYVLAYEHPYRIVGDEAAKIQRHGKVTAIINGKLVA